MTNKIKQIFIIKNSESETLLRLIFSFSQTECFHFCFFLLNVHSKQIQLNFIKLTNIFQQGSLPSTSTINRKRFIILTKPTFILTTICPSFPSSHHPTPPPSDAVQSEPDYMRWPCLGEQNQSVTHLWTFQVLVVKHFSAQTDRSSSVFLLTVKQCRYFLMV